MKHGPKNSITDIEGLHVGNAQDETLKSGVTALICEEMFTTSIAIHGGAPGTRDTELLLPESTVEGADAIVLSGGSAYGLDSASGVQAWLRSQERGFQVGPVRVPITPGAIIFDLINGGDKNWDKYPPYRDLGWQAAQNGSPDFETGSVGAGTGALVAGLKGGLGTASVELDNGIRVAALFAVNAVGSPMIGNSQYFQAALHEIDNEFGGLGLPSPVPPEAQEVRLKFREAMTSAANTTIGIVATDAVLTKSQARRLAIAAHDGIARAIWPAHTPMDGDLVFSVATGRSGVTPEMVDWADLSAQAASVTARAIARGVFDASPQKDDIFPAYQEKRRK